MNWQLFSFRAALEMYRSVKLAIGMCHAKAAPFRIFIKKVEYQTWQTPVVFGINASRMWKVCWFDVHAIMLHALRTRSNVPSTQPSLWECVSVCVRGVHTTHTYTNNGPLSNSTQYLMVIHVLHWMNKCFVILYGARFNVIRMWSGAVLCANY